MPFLIGGRFYNAPSWKIKLGIKIKNLKSSSVLTSGSLPFFTPIPGGSYISGTYQSGCHTKQVLSKFFPEELLKANHPGVLTLCWTVHLNSLGWLSFKRRHPGQYSVDTRDCFLPASLLLQLTADHCPWREEATIQNCPTATVIPGPKVWLISVLFCSPWGCRLLV